MRQGKDAVTILYKSPKEGSLWQYHQIFKNIENNIRLRICAFFRDCHTIRITGRIAVIPHVIPNRQV